MAEKQENKKKTLLLQFKGILGCMIVWNASKPHPLQTTDQVRGSGWNCGKTDVKTEFKLLLYSKYKYNFT